MEPTPTDWDEVSGYPLPSRNLGMIATSKSWRRFWLEYRLNRYGYGAKTA